MGRYIARWSGGVPWEPSESVSFGDICDEVEDLRRAGCTDVAIYRVHDDGSEERLPSYEEALGEVERLRGDAKGADMIIAELREDIDRLSGSTECKACEGHGYLRSMTNEPCKACDAKGHVPVSPLAALEAAERRLLEAGGWTPGDRGFWIDPDDGTQWPREGAISDVRRRLAAKGGA